MANIWLVNPYGPLTEEGWREYRFEILGRTLAARGHSVTWWTSNFSHHFKSTRSEGWQDKSISENFKIRLVPTCKYAHNISIKRLLFEISFCLKMIRNADSYPAPDAIIGIDPPQTIGWASVKLASKYRVPLLLDVFDLWPELFSLALPRWLRKFESLIFYPFYRLRRSNYRAASAVTALCPSYAKLAAEEGCKTLGKNAGTFFNGLKIELVKSISLTAQLPSNLSFLAEKNEKSKYIIYAGSLGPNYDLATLLNASELLSRLNSGVKMLIAGSGPLSGFIMSEITERKLTNVIFLDRLSFSDLLAVYRYCDVALCPYHEMSNVGMPAKFYELIALGLPIITSLAGDVRKLIEEHALGDTYLAGNADSLAQSIISLLADSEKIAQSRENALLLATEFDQDRQYGNFCNFIEENLKLLPDTLDVSQTHAS